MSELQNPQPRYYAKMYCFNRWHIIDRETNLPLYDGAPYGKDKPIIYKDEDVVTNAVSRLNTFVGE